jgi:Raf kinase inhibitor-like YbhB/YbcL family protein
MLFALTMGERAMKLASTSFTTGAPIPSKHSADGEDVSPPLSWSGVPTQTQSFAIVCEDPDAPSPSKPAIEPWVHWVIFNIPPSCTSLPANVERRAEVKEAPGARQGQNSWSKDNLGYRGPAPPPGSGKHRYVFKLYALDALLKAPAEVTAKALRKAMSGHILGEAQVHGTFERP